MKHVTRREFVKNTVFASTILPLSAKVSGRPQSSDKPPASPVTGGPPRLRWIEGDTPAASSGCAWGVAWPMGNHQASAQFQLTTDNGQSIPVQTWATAYWPDGSLKWTGHAIAPADTSHSGYILKTGQPAGPDRAVSVKEGMNRFQVDTGVIKCSIQKSGEAFIGSVERGGRTILENGVLTGLRQDTPEPGATGETFTSTIDHVEVEQDGPVRAVLKATGWHSTKKGRRWLPFTLRLYFHAGSESLRMIHTFVFDGDEHKDFIRGLGVRFSVPMRDEAYNRHIRFVGDGHGLWGEAVKGITGLRRDPGEDVRQAQVGGVETPPIQSWPPTVNTRMHWIPTWGDFSLSQLSANGFTLKKRTQPGHAWVPADQGRRAAGVGYVGGINGGVVFGMRDFWQLHPTQLDIRSANTDKAEVTLWMWSPDAPPMDIRFYHDGLGQDQTGPLLGTAIEGIEVSVPDQPYAKQLDALNITYEDYEPGFGTPHGVARSTEVTLWAMEATPSREKLVELADAVRVPPQLVARPEDYLKASVFGSMWDLPQRNSPARTRIEDRLDWSVRFYKAQVDQRHWYGFWDYGDIMHTYDEDRHVWRYDVGGYAWDNSELSPDLWLWYSFLRTGDTDTYRLSEALTRHTRDVDMYHLGRFAGLGTRHNVQHWGCSAKQLRISTAAYRRFHYFLTTDERTGDVLDEVTEADRMLAELNPVRKLPGQPFRPDSARIGIGTDWGSASANWLTAWERTGNPKYREWLENSMDAIGREDLGFFVGTFAFDPETKIMTPPEATRANASHLSAIFGLVEICAELIQLIPHEDFKRAWLQYCRLYNATPGEQEAELGNALRGAGFPLWHSRLTAYASRLEENPELARRAWDEFLNKEQDYGEWMTTEALTGPEVLNPVDEGNGISTNHAAQWGLAAIQNLALAPQALSG